jgi:valyl-tRNA synthetase
VISDIEIDYKEQDSKLYFIRYFIDSKKDTITIATTRPETIFADVAIAVNPLDKRYKKYIGKKVLVPIINRTIPVI